VVCLCFEQTHNEPDRPPVHQHITTSTRISPFRFFQRGGQVP